MSVVADNTVTKSCRPLRSSSQIALLCPCLTRKRLPPCAPRLRTMPNSASLSPKPSTYSSRTASGLARKILVTLCSTIVRPIGWRSTSEGLCVSKMPSPFCLRIVFCFCLAKSLKMSWSSAFQNSEIT
ncbi:hypothetical protein FQZ97_1132260 [compost metagenome]